MLQRILLILFLLAFASPAFAGFDEGKKAYDKKDWLTAIRELRPLAERGDDRAMILLANMYDNGYGVITSHPIAMSLYKQAAEKNNPQAMDVIGAAYVSARGVDQNLGTALQWFERSAKLGDQTGAFFYASMMLEGNKTRPNEIRPDPYTAYKWYRIAAAENQNKVFQHYSARFAQGIVARKFLTPDQVKQADKEAAAWKPVAARDLGPLPADPPSQKKDPAGNAPGTSLVLKGIIPVPAKNSLFMNSSPPPTAPDIPLPHSEPLQK